MNSSTLESVTTVSSSTISKRTIPSKDVKPLTSQVILFFWVKFKPFPSIQVSAWLSSYKRTSSITCLEMLLEVAHTMRVYASRVRGPLIEPKRCDVSLLEIRLIERVDPKVTGI